MQDKEEQAAQLARWKKDCQHVDDLVNNCPALTDTDALLEWYNETHGWLIYVGNETARAEAYYLTKCAQLLKSATVPDHVFKYVKGSTTLLREYLAGEMPEVYEAWQRLKNLGRNLETILSDMRTNLVNLREINNRDRMTTQHQGRDERKPDTHRNPATGRDVGFPTEQK